MPILAGVLAVLDSLYPPATAQEWDAVGLVLGDPARVVDTVLVAVDPTEEVAAEAAARGAQLLVTHHPLFLRGVTALAATSPGGRVVATLTRAGCALLTIHTNADVARPGVSDALLEAIGVPALPGAEGVLRASAPLAMDGLTVYVPSPDRGRVAAALADAGAGRLGDYERAAFWSGGTGTFMPLPGARPHRGAVGRVEEVAEERLEVLVPRPARAAVLAALRGTHPYEEPAFLLWPLELPSGLGLGRLGELAEAEPLAAFTRRVAAALPAVVGGVRAAGEPDRLVRRVAACGGSGGDLVAVASAAAADVLVTADLRHHPALDALGAGGTALVDVAHWASEWPWCLDAAQRLRAALPAVTVGVSHRVTDPWSLHVPCVSPRPTAPRPTDAA